MFYVWTCIVHGEKGCSVRRSSKQRLGEEKYQWGVWNRAEDPTRKGFSGGYGHWSNGGRNPSSSDDSGATSGNEHQSSSKMSNGRNGGNPKRETNESQGTRSAKSVSVNLGDVIGPKEMKVEDMGKTVRQEPEEVTLSRSGEATRDAEVEKNNKNIGVRGVVNAGGSQKDEKMGCKGKALIGKGPLGHGL